MNDAQLIIQNINDRKSENLLNLMADLMVHPEFELLKDEFFRQIKDIHPITKAEFNRNVAILKCYQILGDYPTTCGQAVELFVQKFPDGTCDDLLVLANDLGLVMLKPYALRSAWNGYWRHGEYQLPKELTSFVDWCRTVPELTDRWVKASELYTQYKRRTKKPISISMFGKLMKGTHSYRGRGKITELMGNVGYNPIYRIHWMSKGHHGRFYYIPANQFGSKPTFRVT